MRNYLLGAAGTYLAAVIALSSSIHSQSSMTSAVAAAAGSGSFPSTPKTSTLQKLLPHKNYLLLVDQYPEIKELSALVGFAGEYGHIEFARDGRIYGCRPSHCSEISLAELEREFPGRKFEVREVESSGDSKMAVQWFKQNLEGKVYDLLQRNCTDAIVGMYEASGDRARRLYPLDVERTYAANEPLRRFMAARGIPKPKRASVYFPDQFVSVGKLIVRGRFSR